MRKYSLHLYNKTQNTFDIFTGTFENIDFAYNALIRRARRHGFMRKGDKFTAWVMRYGGIDGVLYGETVKYVSKVY